MDGGEAFAKIQGEDLTHVFWDELGQEADPQVVLRVRSSMRTSDPTIKTKFIATANPLGPGSWWIRDYIVSKQMPLRIWSCEFFGGSETCWVKSTLHDNPHLSDPAAYEKELIASCFGDESKIAAEVRGEWGAVTAGFFGTCLSVERSMLPGDFKAPWTFDSDGVLRESSKGKFCWIGADWGTASPACALLMCEIQEGIEYGGKYLPRGSWVVVDEEYVCSVQPDGSREWNRGDRSLTVPKFVERVAGLYRRNGLTFRDISERRTVMDSAISAQRLW